MTLDDRYHAPISIALPRGRHCFAWRLVKSTDTCQACHEHALTAGGRADWGIGQRRPRRWRMPLAIHRCSRLRRRPHWLARAGCCRHGGRSILTEPSIFRREIQASSLKKRLRSHLFRI